MLKYLFQFNCDCKSGKIAAIHLIDNDSIYETILIKWKKKKPSTARKYFANDANAHKNH